MVIDVKIKDLSQTDYNLDEQSFPVIIKNNDKVEEMGVLYSKYKENIFELSFYRDLTKAERIILITEIFYRFAVDYYYRYRESKYHYKIEEFSFVELHSVNKNDDSDKAKLEKSVVLKEYLYNHTDEVKFIDTCCGNLVMDIKSAYETIVGEFEKYYTEDDIVSRCKKLKNYNRKELIAFYIVILNLINARGHHIELFNIIKSQELEDTYYNVIFLRDKEKSSYKKE